MADDDSASSSTLHQLLTMIQQQPQRFQQFLQQLSPAEKPTDPDVYIYRGVDAPPGAEKDRVGRWWTTDPYYALRYAGKNGEMYHARLSQSQVNELGHDASIESEFQNYIFPKDPPGVRSVTPQEIEQLRSHQTATPSPVGGPLVKSPANPIAIGQKIFAPGMNVMPPVPIGARLVPIGHPAEFNPPSKGGVDDPPLKPAQLGPEPPKAPKADED